MSKEYIVNGDTLTSMANSVRTLSNTEETYTVDEIATTLNEIAEIGIVGKNEALIFTGAVSATYDGTTAVTVEIPEPGRNIIPMTQDEYDTLVSSGAIEKDALYLIVREGE